MAVPYRKTPIALAISAIVGAPAAQAFEVVPAGDEFEVPQDPANGSQEAPDVANDADGNFVVVWEEGTSPSEILARRFDADGTPQGSAITVPRAIAGSNVDRSNPVVAMDDDGDFAVAWDAYYGYPVYYGNEILFQRFDAAGNPVGSAQRAFNDTSGLAQSEPAIAMDADGDFVIAWEGYYDSTESSGVAYRLFNATSGSPFGPALANQTTANIESDAAVGRSGSGEFVIAWQGDDTDSDGIFARRFGASGSPVSGEFRVNETTQNPQRNPAVDVDDDGDFAVAWVGSDVNNDDRVDARLFDWSGAALTGEVTVSPATGAYQSDPVIALRRDNDSVVAWSASGFDGSETAVVARPLADDGSPDAEIFQVSQETSGFQFDSHIAMDDSGDFTVAFQSPDPVNGDPDVLARQFNAPAESPESPQLPVQGTGGSGTGSLGWIGALGLGLLGLGRRLLGRRRGGGTAGLLAGALALGSFGGAPPAQAAGPQEAGMVEEASGAVTAERARSARSLAEGDSVYVGDRVRTGDDARAVLRLEDGSRISLKPGSDFRVASLREETNEDGNSTFTGMFMDLLRGGLRVITGRVADRNSDNYRLRTPVATIGVRGTEFSALMCARGQCPEDAGDVEEGPEPVARVLEVRGVARAEGPNGATRVLESGAGIFRDDTVTTGEDAWVVLRFADQSKVSLQPATEFRVDEWEFEADEPGAANALLNLVRGGMRVLTGLIGDATGQNYRVETPVATIGVRGTGFDLYCVGSCINRAAEAVNSVSGDGLLVNAWDGEIVAQLEGRLVEFGAGQSGFIANATAAPLRLPSVPELLRDLPAPRPDTVTGSVTQGADRMYTSVEDGTITVQGAQGGPVTLGAGEAAAVASGGAAQPLPSVPGALGEGLGVPAATLAGAVGQLMLAQFDLASLYAGGTTGTTMAGSRRSFEKRVQRDFPGATVTELDSGFGGRVFGGFRLLGLLGVEVGYADLGEIDSAIDPGTADEAAVAEDALDKHPFTPRGIDVSAIAFAPGDIFGNTRAFARAGVFTWEGEIATTTPSGETFTTDVSGTDPLVGGGVEYRVGPRVHARAEWIRYELDPDPVNYVGAGVVWTLQ